MSLRVSYGLVWNHTEIPWLLGRNRILPVLAARESAWPMNQCGVLSFPGYPLRLPGVSQRSSTSGCVTSVPASRQAPRRSGESFQGPFPEESPTNSVGIPSVGWFQTLLKLTGAVCWRGSHSQCSQLTGKVPAECHPPPVCTRVVICTQSHQLGLRGVSYMNWLAGVVICCNY